METTAAGGINKTVREIAKCLSKRGHKIIILQANPLGLVEDDIYDNFRIIRIKSRLDKYSYGLSPEVLFYIKNNIHDWDIDIIHIHGYLTLFSTGIVYFINKIWKFDIPIIFSPHYAPGSHNSLAGRYLGNIYNAFGKSIFDQVDKIICASEYERNCIINYFNLNVDKFVVIPHGVNRIDLPKRHKKANYISLLYAGYLIELKGVQYILKSVYELKYHYGKDVRLTIVGEGNYKPRLIKLAEELSINDSIFWYPFVSGDELYGLYGEANVFLLLSASENYGIVVAEALALGTPCIVANTTSLIEFTKEMGCFGTDYPPDPQELAKQIIEIYESNVKVGPFSDKIVTWDIVVDKYERIYASLIRAR